MDDRPSIAIADRRQSDAWWTADPRTAECSDDGVSRAVADRSDLSSAGLAIAFRRSPVTAWTRSCSSARRQLPGLASATPEAGRWARSRSSSCSRASRTCSRPGAYRGGPMFPAVFLAAAAASWLRTSRGIPFPGRSRRVEAAIVAILRLPLAAVVLATLLTAARRTTERTTHHRRVVVAYIVTLKISTPATSAAEDSTAAAPTPGRWPAPPPLPTDSTDPRRALPLHDGSRAGAMKHTSVGHPSTARTRRL